MPDFLYIVWLLPIIFMFHEFEEILFFEPWVRKNKDFLAKRYPKLAKRFLSRIGGLSVQAFTVAVAEEFLLLSIVTVFSVTFDWYLLWLAIFMGYFIHLLVHTAQYIVLRKYIPGIYTAMLSFIYCGYSIWFILGNNLFSIAEFFIWTVIGCAIVFSNLIFAHKLALIFDNH